jgi:transposase
MSLSLDIRSRIIEAYEKREGSIRKLGKRFKVSPASIMRLLKRYREGGDISPQSPPGRTPLIDNAGLETIHQLIQADTDATLTELCKRFAAKTKLKVAIMTMHRACERLKIKYKKNSVSC